VRVPPGNRSPLRQSIEDTRELHLQYNQNNIAFSFSTTDYREPELMKYYSMLENYDNVWREPGVEKSSNYFNVPPGHYVYRVKAYNSDGVRVETSITIIINPPWWRTWWAYSLYTLIALSIIFAIYRYQKQRIIRNERQKTQLKELAQAKEIEKAYHELSATQAQLIQSEKMASLGELTAGIAHEIQNPLNFVNNFSEVNKELLLELRDEIEKGNFDEVKTLAADVIDNQEKINYHGKRADAIVKGMLQHSRTNTGQKELTDINALADEYFRLTYHGLRAKDKSFNASMRTDFDPKLEKVSIIPQDIGRVFLNLFNNAFYAVTEKRKGLLSPEGGNPRPQKEYEPTVSVSTKKVNGKIEIRIRDNGNGIPSEILDKIFHPFFTTKPTGEGTGLGLSLSYDVIKAHGGELQAINLPGGEGAEFIILLPIE
jgi:signal transduction histidine kinase